MRDTDKDWKNVSASEPYWAVLSVDRFRGRTLSQKDLDAFFDSGESYLRYVLDCVRSFLAPGFEINRALDFGCGVGRLAIPIARAAHGEVIGVDVAPEMLKLCAEHARERKVTNLKLVEGDDRLSQAPGPFNFINTFIVLQHIPPERGVAIIGELLARLEVGGIGVFQMTYGKARKFLKHEEARAPYYRREGQTIIELATRPDLRPEGSITMFDYDLNRVFAVLQEATTFPMIVRPTDDDGHIGVQVMLKKTR